MASMPRSPGEQGGPVAPEPPSLPGPQAVPPSRAALWTLIFGLLTFVTCGASCFPAAICAVGGMMYFIQNPDDHRRRVHLVAGCVAMLAGLLFWMVAHGVYREWRLERQIAQAREEAERFQAEMKPMADIGKAIGRMEALRKAVRAYRVDSNAFPPVEGLAATPEELAVRYRYLTTPIAYLGEPAPDPFFDDGRLLQFAFVGGDLVVWGAGPDQDYDIQALEDLEWPGVAARLYNPNNGTTSNGDVVDYQYLQKTKPSQQGVPQ